MSKKVLFIDRDGTLISEWAEDYQIDDFRKLKFLPGVFTWLRKIAEELDFELVMVTNQDGLGTDRYPEETFWPVQHFVMQCLEGENIHFADVLIDRSFPHENKPTRKPGTGMLLKYLDVNNYDMSGSFVLGDRITDMQLAKNLGCRGIWMVTDPELGSSDTAMDVDGLRRDVIALETTDWQKIYEFLKMGIREVAHERNTRETQISIRLNLDGSGQSNIETGIGFFNHMLDQLARHGNLDLDITTKGDLHIDEHHTIEDTGIALGEAFAQALSDKKGMERYGFFLPMDDCCAQVAIDFGGRNWLVWNAEFRREKIGEMPTEMFSHFFRSFSDAAKCNLYIEAHGENEHHKIEAIFKAFAKSIKMAVKRDPLKNFLPSTKGVL